ncbi:trehalose-phosphatase [Pseudomonas sp. gcc21]|uniref:trehalose-phosphatase n=1 Tax=Pseudomonas sp. gcc21 TaxID=2726989 RepID=UPI00211518FA|nr:trehalose-phosphatase [Pseudomonas sp. gcc21]
MVTIDTAAFSAAVFDLDGVLTRTATVHSAAWKTLFDSYLFKRAAQGGEPFRPFDDHTDYLRYVDGKPRYQGVAGFLESRSITLPYGTPEDSPEEESICGLGNRKNLLFKNLLEQGEIEVFDTTVALIRRLRERGLKTALVTSSENALVVLEKTGLSDLFDARVDGLESIRLGLKGKPHPDIFEKAIELLGVPAQQALGVEDALSGVRSARDAGYRLVIGIDRSSTMRDQLLECGAHHVVDDLGEVVLSPPADESLLPDALADFNAIAKRLERAKPVVFLDYDGTLTPIVDRPEMAVLSDETRTTLVQLAERHTVAIISGRDRRDVEQLVALENLIYAGSHGFDIKGPSGLCMENRQAEGVMPALDSSERLLRDKLAPIEGALVERKRYAIAVHYRLVADSDIEAVSAAVDAAIAQAAPVLRRAGGKKIFELRPSLPWDKGKALSWLLSALDLDHPDQVVPIYLGDDETDEDAFLALRERKGIGILVATEPCVTAAHYRLADTHSVAEFLSRLTQLQERT